MEILSCDNFKIYFYIQDTEEEIECDKTSIYLNKGDSIWYKKDLYRVEEKSIDFDEKKIVIFLEYDN